MGVFSAVGTYTRPLATAGVARTQGVVEGGAVRADHRMVPVMALRAYSRPLSAPTYTTPFATLGAHLTIPPKGVDQFVAPVLPLREYRLSSSHPMYTVFPTTAGEDQVVA